MSEQPNGWYWIAHDRACKRCEERDGLFFRLSTEFKKLHPNCKCEPLYAYVPDPVYSDGDFSGSNSGSSVKAKTTNSDLRPPVDLLERLPFTPSTEDVYEIVDLGGNSVTLYSVRSDYVTDAPFDNLDDDLDIEYGFFCRWDGEKLVRYEGVLPDPISKPGGRLHRLEPGYQWAIAVEVDGHTQLRSQSGLLLKTDPELPEGTEIGDWIVVDASNMKAVEDPDALILKSSIRRPHGFEDICACGCGSRSRFRPDGSRLEKEARIRKIVIEADDRENRIAQLLSYMGQIGAGGHSFSIVVDPDNGEYRKVFSWDGDGSDRINSISVDGVIQKSLDLSDQDAHADSDFIPGAGPRNSQVAFISASPGLIEKARQEPLVGPAGRVFLEKYLEPLGLTKDQVFLSYIVPQVLVSDGHVRGPTGEEVARHLPGLMAELEEVQPRVVVALGKVAKKALGDLAQVSMPHPEAILNKGDSGEVARKLFQVQKAFGHPCVWSARSLSSVFKAYEDDENHTSLAGSAYKDHWQDYYPKTGKGRFVLQAHWRGLTEEETKLSHEDLLQTDRSVHFDLRFELDNRTLWGFTVFGEQTQDRLKAPEGSKLLSLGPSDALQVAWKLPQPHAWLKVADKEPYISSSGGLQSPPQSYSKLFLLDSGSYSFSYADENSREVFLLGEKLKGRLVFRFAPVSSGGKAWVVTWPEDQVAYTLTHAKKDVIESLRDEGQSHIIWSESPGKAPEVLNLRSSTDLFKESAVQILKADEEQRVIYCVALEPDSFDLQGSRFSADAIREAAEEYLKGPRLIYDRHHRPANAQLIDSFFIERDGLLYGQPVRAGSWVVGIHILDDLLWKKVRSGKYRGISVGGRGVRIPVRQNLPSAS